MSTEEIKPGAVYTTAETQELLKVSKSTMKRLLKRGLLRANKIGGQYRILGHELLMMLSPALERKAARQYFKLKQNVVRKINKW
jgi:excisionase family DNA binding protein